ncbi:MAG TPA: DUF1289 domain-containing protein [Pseudomonas xinjiangensis]|uniref:DUF1289 domain-containing protein n=1 Tax=Halopseudomonas xinjiangensis TaxID=487184 RepID=A0A7V1BML4_9GAMM|nr:DUF1289 domain-containing protein [Halopseudomonas xinjiangensis]HEC46855.1 DUF1289 domain-containing protein [Halopseudomonas xinjiangensis]
MNSQQPAPQPVRSPCVGICCMDDDDICTGCQRTGTEIIQWGRLSDDQRRAILALCEARARDQGLWLCATDNKGNLA